MPSPTTSNLPRPRSWDEFEDIVSDVFRDRWGDPYVQRFGRSGQQQYGVDILGRPCHLSGGFAAIQCKNIEQLTVAGVLDEAEKARRFTPAISEFVVASAASRDAIVQREIWGSQDRFPFRLEIVFWEDLCLALSGNASLLQKHYPAWAKATMSTNQILEILAQATPNDFQFFDSPPRYQYLHDVDFRLEQDTGDRPNEYYEPWLDCFQSRAHYATLFHACYRSSRIDTYYFINADGGRVYIPYIYPTIENQRRVSPLQYNLARIINGQHRGTAIVDDALLRCGIIVDASLGTWPARSGA